MDQICSHLKISVTNLIFTKISLMQVAEVYLFAGGIERWGEGQGKLLMKNERGDVVPSIYPCSHYPPFSKEKGPDTKD